MRLEGNPLAYALWSLTVEGAVYSYRPTGSDTLGTIAQTLAGLINAAGAGYTAVGNASGTIALTDGGNRGLEARMTAGRADITGVAAWRVVNIALSGTPALNDVISIQLTGPA